MFWSPRVPPGMTSEPLSGSPGPTCLWVLLGGASLISQALLFLTSNLILIEQSQPGQEPGQAGNHLLSWPSPFSLGQKPCSQVQRFVSSWYDPVPAFPLLTPSI